MLDKEVRQKLDKPLEASRVKHRQGGGGMSLAYLKGHDIIDRANELFNYGEWGYDILLVELCNVTGDNGEVVGGYYAARVRLTVRDCMPITEEGVCPIQEGRNPRAKIDAHDMARKGAVTDAMKRAFRCYGDQFGNSLYDTDLVDGQPGTEKQPAQPPRQQAPTTPTVARVTPNQSNTVNHPTPAPTSPVAARPASTPAQARPVTPAQPNPVPTPPAGPELATEMQKAAITKMAQNNGWDAIELRKRLFDLYGYPLDTLPKADAGHFIKVLQDKVRA